jgi:glucosylceramidase
MGNPLWGTKINPKENYTLSRVIQTAKDTGERLSEIPVLQAAGKESEGVPVLRIVPREQYQSILGFGGAFTEAAAYVLGKLPQEKRESVIGAYFSPIQGINYTMGRVHMNSCDFSLGNYSCDDSDGDKELKDFNISRDQQYLIPFIKAAMDQAGTPIRLTISPWSPPAWMKTNGTMNHGGSLKKDCRQAWARFYSKFIHAYGKEGIPIWAVSVQNEPEAKQTWDSCLYTAEEEGEFVRDYLGPQLQKDGLGDIKILIWDHNRDRIYERAKITLADPETAKYVWGIGFHWYTGEQFANVEKTYREFPDKPLIFTEGCIEGGVQLGKWDRGEIYAHHMIGDFNSGTAGWMDWNLALDRVGGPNHVGNYCDAPVVVDTESGEFYFQSSYYYIGHFSKFIQPGAIRIECASNGLPLETVAFMNPDQRIVVIVLNRTDQDLQFSLNIQDDSMSRLIVKHSIQTIILE